MYAVLAVVHDYDMYNTRSSNHQNNCLKMQINNLKTGGVG